MADGETPPDGHDSIRLSKKEDKRSMVDFGRAMVAEQEARAVIDRILKDGGHMLWERYLMRKAFPFAVDAAVAAVSAGVEMCFVPCDHGEDDAMEDWGLEAEPQPREKDAWARYVLRKKDDSKMRNTFSSTKDSGFGHQRKKGRKISAQKDLSLSPEKPKQVKVEGPRSWSLEEKHLPDKEEEFLREGKMKLDAKKREVEKQKKDEAKAAQQKRAQIEALHEEMDKRLHTYDLNGEVMWVEPPNLQKLPTVLETVGHRIKKEELGKHASAALATVSSPPSAKKKPKKRSRIQDTQDFSDTFIPLVHAQPPILETMDVKQGVSLQHKGSSKPGPPRAPVEGKMTRSEYDAIAQREISGDTQLQFTATGRVRAHGGNSGNSPIEQAPTPTKAKDASPKSATGKDPSPPEKSPEKTPVSNSRSDSLPPLDKGRPPPPEGGGAASSQGGGGLVLGGSGAGVSPADAAALAGARDGKHQPAPQAPPMFTRARKYDAIGHLSRPPRVHPPSLGKLDVFSPKATQPPLGATMGHGLLRHQSTVEEFFFPSFAPEHQAASSLISRSQSDGALPKDRDFNLLPSASLNPSNDDHPANNRSLSHGTLIAQQRSPAYRNVRKILFPKNQEHQSMIPEE